jgi:hypothetical protein
MTINEMIEVLQARNDAMGYRWFIDDFSGPPHTNLVVEGDCPNKANHTPAPMGYVARQEWSKRMSKTHRQITCEQCGLWVIWLPKAEERAVLAERRKCDIAASNACLLEFAEKRKKTAVRRRGKRE